MEIYINTESNGPSSYQIGNDHILIGFVNGEIYEYTYTSAGINNIETMKTLAKAGSGLNSFINSFVKDKYAREIK